MTTISFKIRRLLALSRKRVFADIISWFVFFLITVGFCTIYLWFQFETGKAGEEYGSFLEFVSKKTYAEYEVIRFIEAIKVILINSLIYSLIMMLPVYINLEVFKRYILDEKRILRFWNYTFYLLAVSLNAFLFAGLLFLILKNAPDLLKVKIGFPVNMLTIFGIQLVSTGMLYRREVLIKEREWRRLEQKEEKREALVADLQGRLEEIQISANKNHIKVGSKKKYKIIPLDAILYLKGAGNMTTIYTNDEKGKYHGSKFLSDYKNILPPDLFIQVHRSYIISKIKVTARDNEGFYLDGLEEPIPIGGTFEEQISKDEYLGFLI